MGFFGTLTTFTVGVGFGVYIAQNYEVPPINTYVQDVVRIPAINANFNAVIAEFQACFRLKLNAALLFLQWKTATTWEAKSRKDKDK